METITMAGGFPRPISTNDRLAPGGVREKFAKLGLEYRGAGWYNVEGGIYLVIPAAGLQGLLDVAFFKEDPRPLLGAILRIPDRSWIRIPEVIVRNWPAVVEAAAEIRKFYHRRLADRTAALTEDDRMLRILEKMSGTPLLLQDLPPDAPTHVFADEQCIDSGACDHFHFADFTINLFLTSEVRQAEEIVGTKVDNSYLRMIVPEGNPEHTIVIYPEIWRRNARCGTMQQTRGGQGNGG